MIAYAVSDPSTLRFDEELTPQLKRFATRADWLLYRDKGNPRYRDNARRLHETLSRFPTLRFLIHDDISLARELGVGAVHLSGRGAQRLEEAKSSGLFVVASTHSIAEARGLERRGVDAVTLSPIFPSPGKGTPLGIAYLRKAVQELKVPVIALGGIVTEDQLEQVLRCGAYGFASIRYFAPGS